MVCTFDGNIFRSDRLTHQNVKNIEYTRVLKNEDSDSSIGKFGTNVTGAEICPATEQKFLERDETRNMGKEEEEEEGEVMEVLDRHNGETYLRAVQ